MTIQPSSTDYNVTATLKGDIWVLDAGALGTTEVPRIADAMTAILEMLHTATSDPVEDDTHVILHIAPSAPIAWIRQRAPGED